MLLVGQHESNIVIVAVCAGSITVTKKPAEEECIRIGEKIDEIVCDGGFVPKIKKGETVKV